MVEAEREIVRIPAVVGRSDIWDSKVSLSGGRVLDDVVFGQFSGGTEAVESEPSNQ